MKLLFSIHGTKLLQLVITCLLQVRKTSQAALLVLLEQELIGKGKSIFLSEVYLYDTC